MERTDRTDRIKKLSELPLVTESSRKKVLEIFEDLCIAKRDSQRYFLIQEVYEAIKKTWTDGQIPSMNDVEFYLDQAALSKKSDYRKHTKFGYRYLHEQG